MCISLGEVETLLRSIGFEEQEPYLYRVALGEGVTITVGCDDLQEWIMPRLKELENKENFKHYPKDRLLYRVILHRAKEMLD